MWGFHGMGRVGRYAVRTSRRDTRKGFSMGAKKGRRPPLKGAPVRSRMLYQAITGWEPRKVRLKRAVFYAFVFGIVGGGIALFATGTAPKSGPWTTTGLIIAACLTLAGAVIGYFAGKRRHYPVESQTDTQNEQRR